LIPISLLIELNDKIVEEFPDVKVSVGGGMNYGFIIRTDISGHGGTYHIRHEFTAAQIDLAKDQGALLDMVADNIIYKLKEKGF